VKALLSSQVCRAEAGKSSDTIPNQKQNTERSGEAQQEMDNFLDMGKAVVICFLRTPACGGMHHCTNERQSRRIPGILFSIF
jgi:hypothetical protein